jgi:hypothetical protein
LGQGDQVKTVPDVPGPSRAGRCAAVIGRAANMPNPTLPRAGQRRISATGAAGPGATPANRTLRRKVATVASLQVRPGHDTSKRDGKQKRLDPV